ncbi:MAG: hypothetical protein AAGM22_25215 [Acidobacteriota bacterium]
MDLYLARFPDLRYDEAEIRFFPGALRDPKELNRVIFGKETK